MPSVRVAVVAREGIVAVVAHTAVLVVHIGLRVLMAIEAGEDLSASSIMACDA